MTANVDTNMRTEIDDDLIDSVSKFLMKILRHSPERYGIKLNNRGWASEKDIRICLSNQFEEIYSSKQVPNGIGSTEIIEIQEKTHPFRGGMNL